MLTKSVIVLTKSVIMLTNLYIIEIMKSFFVPIF